MYLTVGLGNPGSKYRETRHNIGFRVINLWAQSLGVRLTGRRFHSRNIRTRFQDKKLLLLRPVTYMNGSGISVRECADYYDVNNDEVLVVHDDLDLPVGKARVARNGGPGGHKGVLSIIEYLGTTQFSRIKVGIGRPRYGEDVEDFVLAPFYRDDENILGRITKAAVYGCELFVSQGVESAMNYLNCLNLANKEDGI